MFVSHIVRLLLEYWLVTVLVSVALYLARNKSYNGLQKYPGPVIAAYTNWWRFIESWSRASHFTHLKLHREHGDIVRLGPNSLSFADPRAVSIIYGLNKGLVKSEFYPVQQPIAKGHRIHSLFSTTDEDYHAKYRRCVNGAFAMSNLMIYEPLVDSTMDAFIKQTRERYSNPGKECNFYRWLHFFALDIISELTWGKRMGFVDEDRDVGGVVKSMGENLAYAAPIGQMPWLDLLWKKNPVKLQLQRWGWNNTISPTTAFAIKQNRDRAGELQKIRQHGSLDMVPGKNVDFLMKFTQAQYDHPDFMDDGQVIATCNSMITAGTETTAISLSAIFYNLLQHPWAYKKLMKELDDAASSGLIAPRANKKVSWAEAQKLPYLDAVLQEAWRLHPAVGMTQEKVVPPEGIEILGQHIPGNTIVGCNPWVLQRRTEIFGEDVDNFRPERWLEASEEQRRAMNATMFQFGGGSRTCIGKHIALFDIYKIVPTFLRNFEFRMVEPHQYRHHCVWMVRILGFQVEIFERQQVDGQTAQKESSMDVHHEGLHV